MNSTDIVGYAYDAALHCVDCAIAAGRTTGDEVSTVFVGEDSHNQSCDDCRRDLETGYTRRHARVELFLSDARGIYIPRDFAQSVKPECLLNVSAEDLAILEAGPDGESYWDVWQDVCDNAVLVSPVDGTRYTVYQEGDCWLIEEGAQWPDDASGFDDLYIEVNGVS